MELIVLNILYMYLLTTERRKQEVTRSVYNDMFENSIHADDIAHIMCCVCLFVCLLDGA